MKQFCECEIQIELVRQKLTNKLGIRAEDAFAAIDREDKSYITVHDVRNFIQRQNMYPTDKSLKLLFERFDKDGGGTVCLDEY